MENLFKEDRTVNIGAMLPSMINSVNNLEGSTSIPSISIEGDEHINTVHWDINNINSCDTIGIQKEVNDLNIENFAWTNQTTKLLLQKYYDRNSKFRDPNIKNKLLWMEIVEEFKIKGYNVNEAILDSKMRNLKQSYENIKNNKKKTSTGRCPITWKWYNTMEDLFKEDQTINVGATLSSMINNINNLEGFTSIPPTLIENEEHINPAYSDIDNINLCEAIGIQKEVNDINIENFAWTNQTTKLLLQKYNDRKNKFRDPKIKKKLLWMEIVEEFKIKGYNVNEAIVDRKMRNLKQSYKSIKDNKKTSTGRNRITWKWYDTMEDLFNEDRTMNVGATLSFVINSVNIKEGSTSILPTSTEDDVHINTIHSGIDNINSCETIGIQKEVNDINIENFAWTNQTTKLLLQKYNDRKSKFRDPKIKKKLLWMEIVEEFKIKGYNVNGAILDRKMRNLKQSYKSIRDKKKTSTGHARITWKWYDTMDDLFKEDQTINVGVTLSSMINSIINQEGSTSIPSTSIEDDEHINTVYSDTNAAQSKMTEHFTESRTSIRCVKESIKGNIYISYWLSNCIHFNFDLYKYEIESSNNFDKNVIVNVNLREQLFISYSPVPDILSKRHPFKNLKEKATESRALYNIRKMMLVGEERRVDAINKLSEKIEEHNKIQRERNDILKCLISLQKNI
ncbi:reticulocyte-binding protein 2b-like [Vespula squamosa]|uniref:Reticulocyte-binding protein 2b-like n=1 Tax=Vespula squamosa TaxID=30214 RepID=A0ABD2BM58_VESSQ